MPHMDETTEAQALLLTLSPEELTALTSLAVGASLRDLALRLETDLFSALRVKKGMKTKLGAELDADAVRVAIYAGLGD